MVDNDVRRPAGALEEKHLRFRPNRNVMDGDRADRLTSTHWHIATALGLGWMLDGIVIALYALIVPYLVADFGISLNALTLWVTAAGLLSAVAAYAWPWLADRFGRRSTFIANVALSALFLVLIVVSQSWPFFIGCYPLMRMTIAGEWVAGSLLTVETWAARHRAMVLSARAVRLRLRRGVRRLTGAYILAPYGW